MGHSIIQIVNLCIFFSDGFFREKVHDPFIQNLVGFSFFSSDMEVCFFLSFYDEKHENCGEGANLQKKSGKD